MNRTPAPTAGSTTRTCAGGTMSPSDAVTLVVCVLATVLFAVLDVASGVAAWAFAGAAAGGGLVVAVRWQRRRGTTPR